MCVISTAAAGTAALAFAANASLAMSAIGAVMTAYGSYQQQKSANAQAEYQAKLSERNAQVADMEAKYARDTAAEKEKTHRQKVRQFVGRQRAAQSSSGVAVDQGSNLDVTLDTVEGGELDAMAIHHEGEINAWRAGINAGNHRAQAGLYRSGKSSPFMAAAPSMLQGLASVGSGYSNLGRMEAKYQNSLKAK